MPCVDPSETLNIDHTARVLQTHLIPLKYCKWWDVFEEGSHGDSTRQKSDVMALILAVTGKP